MTAKLAAIDTDVNMMQAAMKLKIRDLRMTAPRLSADGIAQALGAIWEKTGGGAAPTAIAEVLNPGQASPPLVEAEQVPNSIAAKPQSTPNWNIFLDKGFVASFLAPPTPEQLANGPGATANADTEDGARRADHMPVDMAGAGHTLSADPSTGNVDLNSVPGRLLAKLRSIPRPGAAGARWRHCAAEAAG